jgi:hypothetical protein
MLRVRDLGETMRALMKVGFSAVLALVVTAAPARAQIFISATGDDDNNCGRTAPCRTLQRGIDTTGAGRELTILNSGEYGRAAIAKSITIVANGVSANIRSFAAGADAITIDDPAAKVVLRGLFLTGGGTGRHGINIVAAAAVHIEDCRIERFDENGIHDFGSTELFVTDTVSRENGRDGLFATGFLGPAERLTVDNSQFEDNGSDGLDFDHLEAASITRTVVARNGAIGMTQSGGEANVTWTTAADNGFSGYELYSGGPGGGGRMRVEFSTARGNDYAGFLVRTGATGVISNSVVTDNGFGLRNEGTLLSRRNNTVTGNTTSTSGTITLLPGL